MLSRLNTRPNVPAVPTLTMPVGSGSARAVSCARCRPRAPNQPCGRGPRLLASRYSRLTVPLSPVSRGHEFLHAREAHTRVALREFKISSAVSSPSPPRRSRERVSAPLLLR